MANLNWALQRKLGWKKTNFPAYVTANFGKNANVIYMQKNAEGKTEGTVKKAGKYFDVVFSAGEYVSVEAA